MALITIPKQTAKAFGLILVILAAVGGIYVAGTDYNTVKNDVEALKARPIQTIIVEPTVEPTASPSAQPTVGVFKPSTLRSVQPTVSPSVSVR